jgi:hypothetical protein
MSVSLLIKDAKNAEQRLVPVATQAIFKSKWIPGAQQLALEWVDLMETGFDVTMENREDVLDELCRLREWMEQHDETQELERLDQLVAEVAAIRFDAGATAFRG